MNSPIPTIKNTPDEICAHIADLPTEEDKNIFFSDILNQAYIEDDIGTGKEVALCMSVIKGSFPKKLKEHAANSLFGLHAVIRDSFEIVDVATSILPLIKKEIRPNIAATLLRTLDKREYILNYNLGPTFLINALTVIEKAVPKNEKEHEEAVFWIDNIAFLQSMATNIDEHFDELTKKLGGRFIPEEKKKNNGEEEPISIQAIYHISCQLITSNRSVPLAIQGLQYCSDKDQFNPELPREMLELYSQSKECSMINKGVIDHYLEPFRRDKRIRGQSGTKKLYSHQVNKNAGPQ